MSTATLLPTMSPQESAQRERAASTEADLLVRKVQKLAAVLRLAESVKELRPLCELKSFARGGAHAVYFGALPTTFHLFRSARDASRDRLGPLGALEVRKQLIHEGPAVQYEVWDEDAKRRAKPTMQSDHVVELNAWDVRGLVDLALTTAHAKLRQGSSWKGNNSSPPPSPRARVSELSTTGRQAAMQPPSWEHLEQLRCGHAERARARTHPHALHIGGV
jgi:hypothetical protein